MVQKNTRRRKPQKRQMRLKLYMKLGMVVLMILTAVLGIGKLFESDQYAEKKGAAIDSTQPEIDVQLLDVNDYSRSGAKSDKITGIVMHYTANPGATAQQNRNYFNGLKDSHETKASSHFIIGLDGEIVQCIPTWEVAYASNNRNSDTVSIECCHPDENGQFNDATYQSMVQLTAWLCRKFGLTEKDVIRHYDITEKICPKYFVEDEDAWKQYKADVKRALGK